MHEETHESETGKCWRPRPPYYLVGLGTTEAELAAAAKGMAEYALDHRANEAVPAAFYLMANPDITPTPRMLEIKAEVLMGPGAGWNPGAPKAMSAPPATRLATRLLSTDPKVDQVIYVAEQDRGAYHALLCIAVAAKCRDEAQALDFGGKALEGILAEYRKRRAVHTDMEGPEAEEAAGDPKAFGIEESTEEIPKATMEELQAMAWDWSVTREPAGPTNIMVAVHEVFFSVKDDGAVDAVLSEEAVENAEAHKLVQRTLDPEGALAKLFSDFSDIGRS